MNCFFCNYELYHDPYCKKDWCLQHKVVHAFIGLFEPYLYKAEFLGTFQGEYVVVSYLVTPNKMDTEKPSCTVTQRTKRGDYKKLITIPYPPITLTPFNYKEKLKTYLIFS